MQYIIPLVAFVGLLIGRLIGKMAADEVVPGRPYFFSAKRVIIFAMAVLLAINLKLDTQLLIAGVAGIVSGLAFKQIYSWFGFALVGGIEILAIGILVFIYGLIYGTEERTWIKEMILFGIAYLFIFAPVSNNIVSAFAMGGLFVNLFRNEN